MSTTKTNDVLGLGHALLDLVVQIDDSILLELNLKKGESTLVDHARAEEILQQVQQRQLKLELLPGGSTANTLRGIGILGGNVILCGVVGNDVHGAWYEEEIKRHNVEARIKKHNSLTGHALTFVTPDSERTFSVHLGASVHMYKEDVLEGDIRLSKIMHLEAYQFDDAQEMVLHAINLAKAQGTLVSIDFSDPGVIRRHKNLLDNLLPQLDIIFLNEKEAIEFTGLAAREAVEELGKKVRIAIVKLGEQGSLIAHQGKIISINPAPAQAIDTNGAGDSYAAGFLYGYCSGWSLAQGGKLGSLLAAKVVEQRGVQFGSINVEELKQEAMRHG